MPNRCWADSSSPQPGATVSRRPSRTRNASRQRQAADEARDSAAERSDAVRTSRASGRTNSSEQGGARATRRRRRFGRTISATGMATRVSRATSLFNSTAAVVCLYPDAFSRCAASRRRPVSPRGRLTSHRHRLLLRRCPSASWLARTPVRPSFSAWLPSRRPNADRAPAAARARELGSDALFALESHRRATADSGDEGESADALDTRCLAPALDPNPPHRRSPSLHSHQQQQPSPC